MAAAFLLLAALFFPSCLGAQDSKAPPPTFTADSIVNSANNSSASLTPNVLASIYGTALSYSTQAVSLETVGAGQLPATLAGVQVTVRGLHASLLYVSPTQINFLVPSNLLPGQVDVSVFREGVQ